MQTELEFKKISADGSTMVAEAVVTNDFNIHIEMEDKGMVTVKISTVPDSALAVKDEKTIDKDSAFDEDYEVLVVPKYLHIKATSIVSKGILQVKEG